MNKEQFALAIKSPNGKTKILKRFEDKEAAQKVANKLIAEGTTEDLFLVERGEFGENSWKIIEKLKEQKQSVEPPLSSTFTSMLPTIIGIFLVIVACGFMLAQQKDKIPAEKQSPLLVEQPASPSVDLVSVPTEPNPTEKQEPRQIVPVSDLPKDKLDDSLLTSLDTLVGRLYQQKPQPKNKFEKEKDYLSRIRKYYLDEFPVNVDDYYLLKESESYGTPDYNAEKEEFYFRVEKWETLKIDSSATGSYYATNSFGVGTTVEKESWSLIKLEFLNAFSDYPYPEKCNLPCKVFTYKAATSTAEKIADNLELVYIIKLIPPYSHTATSYKTAKMDSPTEETTTTDYIYSALHGIYIRNKKSKEVLYYQKLSKSELVLTDYVLSKSDLDLWTYRLDDYFREAAYAIIRGSKVILKESDYSPNAKRLVTFKTLEQLAEWRTRNYPN